MPDNNPDNDAKYDQRQSMSPTQAVIPILRVFACGGTFDKCYDELTGELTFGSTHIPAILHQARLDGRYACSILPLQDSLDMNDADRERILDHCRNANEKKLVIVHGTDTMAETARLIDLARLDKTIVLTGAMIPFAIEHSDAVFNLGFACAAAQTLAAGVHVAMNGRVFPARQVRKDRQAGRFEATS